MSISNLSDIALNNGKLHSEKKESVCSDPLSIDQIIDSALIHCQNLPLSCSSYVAQIKELRSRLAKGQLHLAILGQFNRGKSTFINALIQQRILPTSVLPVTSVPTYISYGDDLSCTVRFLKKIPELVVNHSPERIVDTLLTYVAESNNQNNQYCVKDVRICCPSAILQNGTVLIDTPGFGSTFIHNTQTALDSLADCDAVIFLLSADPPMTQTEIEFLKQVQRHVPRIFFILNKIDLVSNKDIEKIDLFIKEMLSSRLGYSSEIKLFHVCASRAEIASECDQNNPDWVAGNMDIIKSEIVEFMVREKYFTLSQALNDKLLEALKGIVSSLQCGIDEFNSPLEHLEKEYKEISVQVDNIRKNMDKELKLIQVEKNAVLRFIGEQLSSQKEQLEKQVNSHLVNLLNNSSGNLSWLDGLAIALGRFVTDCFSQLLITSIAQVNKPIRKAVSVHVREYGVIADVVEKFVSCANRKAIFNERLETIEIAIENAWFADDVSSELDTKTAWTDYFRNRNSRIEGIQQKWSTTLKNAIQDNFNSLDNHLNKIVDDAFEKIKSVLTEEYLYLSKELNVVIEKKKTAVDERLKRTDNPVQDFKKLINVFSGFLDNLC